MNVLQTTTSGEVTMNKHRRLSTIRDRMIALNFLVFSFIGLLIVAYFYHFFLTEKNLFVLEDFHDLFDYVLEVRRYEKNFFLGVGKENVPTILEFINKINAETARLEDDIVNVTGNDKFLEFKNSLDRYRDIFLDLKEKHHSKINLIAVREKGKELVDFTEQLLDDKQQLIQYNMKVAILTITFITGLFFIFIIIALHFQAKNILDRIAFVQRATKSIVNGNFKPLEYKKVYHDEIGSLIEAFNKMAAELEIQQEQLIQSKKLASIGTFSSGIAHELNNPLNNISLSADTLREELSTLTHEEATEIIEDIITQTDRASEVVKNLLDFSRDKVPTTQLLNIKQVISSTKKLIANELRLNSILIEEQVSDNLPLIMGDMQKLQQVFLNLFLNSIHVMPEGGLIHIEAKVVLSGYLRINVSDTGIGIEPENLEHIFDPFFTTKEVGKGTGLGLSIVYGIIKKHKGFIEVKSEIDEGTTFSIFLPIASSVKQIAA